MCWRSCGAPFPPSAHSVGLQPVYDAVTGTASLVSRAVEIAGGVKDQVAVRVFSVVLAGEGMKHVSVNPLEPGASSKTTPYPEVPPEFVVP